MSVIERAEAFHDRPAIVDTAGRHTYRSLLESSRGHAAALLRDRSDLAEERVGLMVEPSARWVAWLWAIWRAGGVAMPISLSAAPAELEYALADAGARSVVVDGRFDPTIRPVAERLGVDLIPTSATRTPASLPTVAADRRAMILSTSGTTGRPKGVVSSHSAIEAQIGCLVEAWEWSRDDRILLTLPLHHVHGIVNVVSCALWSGSTVEMAPGFDVEATWNRLASGELTLYMAVPTVYRRLIERWTEVDEAEQSRLRAGCGALRLMVSGSAALPVDTLRRWEQMTGHVLLERYGMTEIGMALSNPLRGERTPGAVGSALPGVEVRLVADDGSECADGDPGEIEVRTPGMFSEYWNMPEATLAAFRDGWFRTGDVAVRSDGIYRILGRSSIDIIKTGGEKVSALEIEDVLIGHDRVGEVAVVGVPDDVWGERIVAAVVARSPVGAEELRAWCRRSLAGYKVPKEVVFVESLPRNSLGKVMKTRVVTEMSNRE